MAEHGFSTDGIQAKETFHHATACACEESRSCHRLWEHFSGIFILFLCTIKNLGKQLYAAALCEDDIFRYWVLGRLHDLQGGTWCYMGFGAHPTPTSQHQGP